MAAQQGWMLCVVIDGQRASPQILPLKFEPPLASAMDARRFVATQALNGHPVARKALALITRDAMPPAAKRPRKKEKA